MWSSTMTLPDSGLFSEEALITLPGTVCISRIHTPTSPISTAKSHISFTTRHSNFATVTAPTPVSTTTKPPTLVRPASLSA